tara:strand:- start:2393 stop:3508 length:1116 start_codon:yes stop_codon:yes gene_type:complete
MPFPLKSQGFLMLSDLTAKINVINVKRSSQSLKLADIFPEGDPKGKKLKELRKAFSNGFSRTKSWFPANNNQLGSESGEQTDSSLAPFVSTNLINSATPLINAAGDALANALANIEFGDVSKTNKGFTISSSGSLAEFKINMSGKKKGSSSFGKAQVAIQKLKNTVTGLDKLVADGFNTISLSDDITGDTESQTFPYSVSSDSGSGVKDSIDYKIRVKAWEPILGIKVFDKTFKGSPTLTSPYADMDAVIENTIQYDSSTLKATSKKYKFDDLLVSPTLEDSWGKYWDSVFGDVSNWWDKNIGKSTNPFRTIDKNVQKQLNSTDDFLIKQIEDVVSSQLNSGSVKPAIDTTFEALYSVGWDQSTYPMTGWS